MSKTEEQVRVDKPKYTLRRWLYEQNDYLLSKFYNECEEIPESSEIIAAKDAEIARLREGLEKSNNRMYAVLTTQAIHRDVENRV